ASSHPLSRAVTKLSDARIALSEWQEIRGSGLQARLAENKFHPTHGGDASEQSSGDEEGHSGVPDREQAASKNSAATPLIRLGSLAWLRANGVDLAGATDFIAQWSDRGATILGLAIDRQLKALFALRDTLKPSARDVIQQLQRHHYCVYLVTGDHKATATAIARQAGIPVENVFAEIRPESKDEIIR